MTNGPRQSELLHHSSDPALLQPLPPHLHLQLHWCVLRLALYSDHLPPMPLPKFSGQEPVSQVCQRVWLLQQKLARPRTCKIFWLYHKPLLPFHTCDTWTLHALPLRILVRQCLHMCRTQIEPPASFEPDLLLRSRSKDAVLPLSKGRDKFLLPSNAWIVRYVHELPVKTLDLGDQSWIQNLHEGEAKNKEEATPEDVAFLLKLPWASQEYFTLTMSNSKDLGSRWLVEVQQKNVLDSTHSKGSIFWQRYLTSCLTLDLLSHCYECDTQNQKSTSEGLELLQAAATSQ